MAIDFTGVAVSDNYATAFVPKLQGGQQGLACWLDPAVVAYTGTPYTGAFRLNSGNSGAVERFNGSAWVSQAVQGISFSGGIPNIGGSTILKASDADILPTPGKLALRDNGGNLQAVYFSQQSADGENPTVAQVFVGAAGSNLLRKASLSYFGAQLGAQDIVHIGWQRFQGTGDWVGIAGPAGTLQAFHPTTGPAVMSFHRAAAYAINMGLDPDNYFRLGGWSDGFETYRFIVGPTGDLRAGAFHPGLGANHIATRTGSYGSMDIVGLGGGYSGLHFPSSAGSVTGMFDANGNGGDYDPATSFHFYWNRAHTCLALGGSVTAAGYRAYTNGGHYVANELRAGSPVYGNNGVKGFGAITLSTSVAPPSGGASGDFHFIY